MAVTSKELRSARATRSSDRHVQQPAQVALYGVILLFGAFVVYALVGMLFDKGRVLYDDMHYGRPRTDQITAFVGHNDAAGTPTHLLAVNLNRQVTIIELPGGDATQARTITGPYLFGANEDLTPVTLALQDIDGDNVLDLLVDVRNERIVYLNHDGVFRLPTPAEQATLATNLQ